jgi:hypothetical protein
MKKDRDSNIKQATSGKNDAATHIAIDLEFAKAAEEEICAALTPIRAAITLRENNPHLDPDTTLELTLPLPTCR